MTSLYATLLGNQFHTLAPLLQRFHTQYGETWQGEAAINTHTHPVLRLLLRIAGLPKSGAGVAATVRVNLQAGSECWQRVFAGRRMYSNQTVHGSDLHEGFGPLSLILENRIEQGALHQFSTANRVLGLPMPRWLGLAVTAREWQADDRFNFDVAIRFLNRTLIHYRGWLRPQAKD